MEGKAYEFAIWGIPPGKDEETLLVAMPHGKPITTIIEAQRLAEALLSQHQCRNVRIQHIDGSLPDFTVRNRY
jgi:hypothetical protein